MDEGKTTNCPECGNPVAVTDQFCPKCFARLKPPGWWRKFLSLFQSAGQSRPARPIINIRKTVTIKTVGEDGQPHEYHSLDEVPPGLRAEIEKLESDVMKEKGESVSFTEKPPAGNATKARLINKKSFVVYQIKDATGQERIYRSLDEVPWEKRSQIEKLGAEAMNEADLLSSETVEQVRDTPGISRKSISIYKVRDASGQERVYHSLAELPPDIQAQIEKLESEALDDNLDPSPPDAPASLTVVQKNVSIFKVKDAQGNERTYHSLDEMPPDIRVLFERAQKQIDGP